MHSSQRHGLHWSTPRRRHRGAMQIRGSLPGVWGPESPSDCVIIQHSQPFPSPLFTQPFPHFMPQQMTFALSQGHAPGSSTFLSLLKFFATSGMPFCLLLCQFSQYYWFLRFCAKSFFFLWSLLYSVLLEMIIAHYLFIFGGIFSISPCGHVLSEG